MADQKVGTESESSPIADLIHWTVGYRIGWIFCKLDTAQYIVYDFKYQKSKNNWNFLNLIKIIYLKQTETQFF